MPVPNTFGTATSAIPLSQLDANFATPITIGNTAVQLGNTVTTLNNMTLANVTISSGTITITNVAVTTANVSGTANVSTLVVVGNATVGGNTTITGNITSSTLTSGRVTFATTSGRLTDSANLLYSGTDLTVYGLTVGRGAGAVATNTVVGYQAAFSNVSGSNNSYLGYQSGYYQTGSSNTALGYGALVGTAAVSNTGTNSVAIGLNALIANYSGGFNTAVGSEALKANTTASDNTAVGYQAGYTNQTGARNTFIGEGAGYSTTSSFNAFIGNHAGYNTTGGSNTFVGDYSGYLVTSGTKNTILGKYDGFAPPISGTGSNYIVLSDGDGNPRGIFDGSGNFVVGAVGATSNSAAGAVLTPNGYVRSIATASVNATTTLEVYSTGASAFRFYVGLGGTVYATNTTITAISDQRLKENIRDLDDGLDVVMALKPRKFDWKEGKGANIKNARGFIAQEFEAVLPDMIEEWRDPAPEGEEAYKAINANLIPTLVKAIQELKAEVDSLKAQINGA